MCIRDRSDRRAERVASGRPGPETVGQQGGREGDAGSERPLRGDSAGEHGSVEGAHGGSDATAAPVSIAPDDWEEDTSVHIAQADLLRKKILEELDLVTEAAKHRDPRRD